MIWSNGCHYALSVSHPFCSSSTTESIATEPGLFDEVDEHDYDSSSDEDDINSLFDGFEAVLEITIPAFWQQTESEFKASHEKTVAPELAQDHDVVASGGSRQINFYTLGQIASHSSKYKDETGIEYDYDWVLIELDSSVKPLPNSFTGPENVEIPILWSNDFSTIFSGNKVIVLAGFSGHQDGRIGQRDVRFTIRGCTYEVIQILLSKPLGTWCPYANLVSG